MATPKNNTPAPKSQMASIKDLIKVEYKRCLEEPMYFMKKYVKIQHPIRGTIKFDLFKFQEETLQQFVDNNFNIVLKSRQMGISTLVAAYSLWLMTFHTDKNILCISITQDTAKEIVTKVRFANDNLPNWMKQQCAEDNRLSLKLKNGSQIKAVSSAGTSGRSSSTSLLILDECFCALSTIYIRNKVTGQVKSVTLGEIYEQEEYK